MNSPAQGEHFWYPHELHTTPRKKDMSSWKLIFLPKTAPSAAQAREMTFDFEEIKTRSCYVSI